jgi:hypothetical protein
MRIKVKSEYILEEDFDTVHSRVSSFHCPEEDLTIQTLETNSDSILFGCYVPTIPRPTTIIAGKIFLMRLPDHRTRLIAIDFQDWSRPFLESLIKELC